MLQVYYSWKLTEDGMTHKNTQNRLYRKIKRNNCYYDIFNRSSNFNQMMTRRSYKTQMGESSEETVKSPRPQREASSRIARSLATGAMISEPRTNKRATAQTNKRKSKSKETLDSVSESEKALSRSQRDRKPSRKILECFESLENSTGRVQKVQAVGTEQSLKEARKSKSITSAEKLPKTLKNTKAVSQSTCEKVKVLDEITLSDSEESNFETKVLDTVNTAPTPVPRTSNSAPMDVFSNKDCNVNQCQDLIDKECNLLLPDFCDQIAKAEDLGFNIVDDDDFWMSDSAAPVNGILGHEIVNLETFEDWVMMAL